MAKHPNYEKNLKRLATRSPEELTELEHIEREAIANYSGLIDELEKALGVLRLGQHIGWKPLILIHNKRTLRKYEDILGIEFRKYFPEEGPSAERPLGYRVAKQLGKFWKAVSGDEKIEDKRKIE